MFDKFKGIIKAIVNKIFSTDDSHEFKPLLSEIEHSPVSPLGRFTFWTIVTLIFISILWLCLGQVDIVITARGIVIPDGEAKIIQPLDTGVISKILVREGEFVKKGQVLMEINQATTEPELRSINKNLKNINLEIERLDAVSNGKSFSPKTKDINKEELALQKTLYEANIDSLKKQLKIKEEELIKVNDQMKSAQSEKSTTEELLASYKDREHRLKNVIDVIAYDEYQDVVNQLKSYSSQVLQLKCKLNELKTQKQQVRDEITYIKASFKSDKLEQLAEKQKQAIQLQAEADQILFRNEQQKIVAPCDGHIDKLFIHTDGGVVTPAQQLIALTPSNTPLMIKATVLNQDIGFVKEALPVSVKIDTYNFQKYGMIEGKVHHVSKNSIMDENLGPVYEILVMPLTKSLKVEGEEESIQSGMSLSAEIKVGKRRIIEFFVYPLIKYLDEGMSVR